MKLGSERGETCLVPRLTCRLCRGSFLNFLADFCPYPQHQAPLLLDPPSSYRSLRLSSQGWTDRMPPALACSCGFPW